MPSTVTAQTFGRVPTELLTSDASDRACRLYALLTRYADQFDRCHPGRRRLAGELRCSEWTLDRAVRELVTAGWLAVEHRNVPGSRELTTNSYRLLQPDVVADVPPGGGSAAPTGGSTGATTGGCTRAEGTEASLNEEDHPSISPSVEADQAVLASPPPAHPSRKREREGDPSKPASNGKAPEPVFRVFDAWRASAGKPRAQLDPKRQRLITAALGLGYTAEELCQAVAGWERSPHHRGENDRGTVYNDLGLLLRDAGHIDRFLGYARGEGLRVPARNGNGRPPARQQEFATYEQSGPIAL